MNIVYSIITPCTRARGKAIVYYENCQILSASVHAVTSYNKWVDIGEKLVFVCFELLNVAH